MCRHTLVLACVLVGSAGWARCTAAQPVPPGEHGAASGAPLLAIDSLLYIDNRGLRRVFVRLNEHRFTLTTDPAEVERSANAYPIPARGAITIHIRDLLAADDADPFDDTCEGFPDRDSAGTGNNCVVFSSQGDAGADAQIVIADLFFPGEAIAYAIRQAALVPLPERLEIHPAYPNPFRAIVTIPFSVPENRTSGVPVHIAVFDRTGRLVRVLVDDRYYPGDFTVRWDGRAAGLEPVPSGVYLVRVRVGELQQTSRLTYLR